jgi:hypothetical protein
MKAGSILPMVIFILVLAIAWMTIGGSSGYADIYMPKTQTDYPENDIKTYNGSLDECKTACSADPLCKGFVMSSNGKMCILKNKMAGARATTSWDAYGKSGTELPEVVSRKNTGWSVDQDHVKWTYEIATDYPGGDLASIPYQSDATCARICEKTNGCVGAVRDISDSGLCVLKNAKGAGSFKRDRNSFFFR